MKRIFKLMGVGKMDQARAAYRRMWDDCIVTTGRKTGDEKVWLSRPSILGLLG